MLKKVIFIGCLLILTYSTSLGQILDATIPSNVCIGEQLSITNTSTGFNSYEWDFCVGDLELSPAVDIHLTNSSFNIPFTMKLAMDDSWHGFIPSFSSNVVYRYDYQNGLNGEAAGTELTGLDGLLNQPVGIDLILDHNGNWYGYLVNLGSNEVTRVSFGSSLLNPPSAMNFTGFGLNAPDGIEIVEDDTSYKALITSDDDLYILDLGSDLSTDPTLLGSIAVVSSSRLYSISTLKQGNNIYAIMTDRDGSDLHHIDFGTTIDLSPTINDINEGTYVVNDPVDIEFTYENGNYYGFFAQRNNPVVRLEFGSNISNLSPTFTEVYDKSDPNVFGFTLAKDSSRWVGMVVSGGMNEIARLVFNEDCGIVPDYVIEDSPSLIVYDSEGSRTIELIGSTALTSDTITSNISISSDFAPPISFAINPSQCISTPNTFIPTTGLSTYAWDFDNDGAVDSNDENPTHQFLTTGTHTVRLDVSDGTCNNFTEQQITIYPDPPAPVFSAVTEECVGASIAFTNSTDESLHTGAISYEWDFNGEATSTDRDPTFVFATSGTKQITLKSIIPGCENTSSVFEINISPGPTSAFTLSSLSICEGETISFTDASTNGPIGWQWNFGDGFNSTAQNPDHLFTAAGNYMVDLTVTDALGCQNTIQQEVSVSSLPNALFDFDVPCTSSGGIQFTDLSTVSGADIFSRTWFVDNDDAILGSEQGLPNPVINFGTEGTVNVRLVTMSSTGCESSYNQDIQILATPQPDFGVTIGCNGETTSFSDMTSSPGNTVGSWLWTLDGVTYNTQNIDHTFSTSGTFDVTLEVTGQNFCSETMTRQVTILELPTVNFSVVGDCSNEIIQLDDVSSSVQDPISSRTWTLDGISQGSGPQLLLQSLAEGTYGLMLEVTTASGCVTSTSQQLVVNQAPQSIFSSTRTFGVPDDQITFTNESIGASNYQWLLDGTPLTTSPDQQAIIFTEPGTYEVTLVSGNDLGCNDTSTSEILIAVPEVDLSIGQFEVVANQNTGTIFLEITNNSNLPVEVTEAVIELQNQFSVTEQVESLIGIGETRLVNLNVGIPLNSAELNYLCVTLNSQYTEYPDITPVNNEKCVTIAPKVVVEAPFPNPSTDYTRVKLIAPENGAATISLFNSAGKVEFKTEETVTTGLNNFFIYLSDLKTGIYFIELNYAETRSVQRIIKL